MPITKEQLRARRAWIGASDVAAIVGLSPYAGPGDIYWGKVSDEDIPEPPPRAHQEQGNRHERAIIEGAQERLGSRWAALEINPPTLGPVEIEGAPFGAHLDSLLRGDPCGAIEAKRSRLPSEEWGTPGTDEVPVHVLLQVQAQMGVAERLGLDLPEVVVAVELHNLNEELYIVKRNADLIAEAFRLCAAFWKRHVVPRVPPDGCPPPLEMLKRMRREPASVCALGPDAMALWRELEAAKAQRKAAEQAEELAKAKVIAALKGCEAGEWPDGSRLTYLEQRSAPAVDTTLLRAKWPEAFEACVTQGTHRVLRFVKPKANRKETTHV